jgi:hypothetical protein
MMSHRVVVAMIADQEITINDKEVNIHDIDTIVVSSTGQIVGVVLQDPQHIVSDKE